jgi:hypothetical protein
LAAQLKTARPTTRFRALATLVLVAQTAAMSCDTEPAKQHPRVGIEVIGTSPLLDDPRIASIVDAVWATDSTLIATINGGSALAAIHLDGAVERIFATSGNGPGEVASALWLDIGGDTAVVSFDVGNSRVSWWSLTGTHLRSLRLDQAPFYGGWVTPAGMVIKAAGAGTVRFLRMTTAGQLLGTVALDARASSPDATCGYCPGAVRSDGLVAAAASDTSYRILLAAEGSRQVAYAERRSLPAIPLSPLERDSAAAVWQKAIDYMTSRPATTPASLERFRAIAGQQVFKKRFLHNAFWYDTSDRLWVQRSVTAGDSAALDLFDRDGKFVAAFLLPPAARVLDIRRDKILASLENSNGMLRFVYLRLTHSNSNE